MLYFVFLKGPPSPPLDLVIPDASREHISITWKVPAKNGGSHITGYHVEISEAGTEKWMRVNSRPIKELKYKVEEGIIPEKQYVLRVRAINSIGVSDPSAISDKVFAKDPDCKCTSINMCKTFAILKIWKTCNDCVFFLRYTYYGSTGPRHCCC